MAFNILNLKMQKKKLNSIFAEQLEILQRDYDLPKNGIKELEERMKDLPDVNEEIIEKYDPLFFFPDLVKLFPAEQKFILLIDNYDAICHDALKHIEEHAFQDTTSKKKLVVNSNIAESNILFQKKFLRDLITNARNTVYSGGAKEMNIFLFGQLNFLGEPDNMLTYGCFDLFDLKFIGISKQELREQIFPKLIASKYQTAEKEMVKYIEDIIFNFIEKSFN